MPAVSEKRKYKVSAIASLSLFSVFGKYIETEVIAKNMPEAKKLGIGKILKEHPKVWRMDLHYINVRRA